MLRLLLSSAFVLILYSAITCAQDQTPPAPDAPFFAGAGSPVSPPVPVSQPLPPYTEEAKQAKIEGTVLIQAVIGRNGQAERLKVLRSLGYGLDQSVMETIKSKWRFKPGTLNGEAVDVQANIEVTFRLPVPNPAGGEYPLSAVILESRLNQNPYGSPTFTGSGRITENGSLREFEYSCSCSPLNPVARSYPYAAKWKKTASRLEILVGEIGDIKKQKKCELKVHMTK